MNSLAANKIVTFLKAKRSDMIVFLNQLVAIETPTLSPGAQQPILDLIQQSLESLDYHVIRMPGNRSGGYLVARPKDRIKANPLQLMIGHCDTVWPIGTIEQMPILFENGVMKGPGIYDMKAGITQMIFALKAIQTLDLPISHTPIILINSDEEKGSFDSTKAIRCISKIVSRAYVLEPPFGYNGKLKTARKGLGRFSLTVQGVPSHAGLDPTKGASAILELSHQVQQLFALNDFEKGISVNVGMIEGGTHANVIASTSKAIIDVRVLTSEDGDNITEKIHALKAVHPDVRLIVEGGIGRPPMEKTERNQTLWLAAKNLGQELGIELEETTVGGGSDGNTSSQYTATLDGLGTTGDGAHAHHEHILQEKLFERTALLTLLLTMNES